MAHPSKTRLALRAAYLGGLPIEQAARKSGVPEGTARRWKSAAMAEGDDWDKFQRASLMVADGGFDQAMGRVAAGVILRAEALLELLGKDDGSVDPIEATKMVGILTDSLAKAHAACRRLMPQTDRYAVALDVLGKLGAFAIAHKPGPFATELAALIEAFGAELAREWG